MSAPSKRGRWRITRRGLLISTGVVGVGLALGWRFGLPAAQLSIANMVDGLGGMPGSLKNTPDGWFELSNEGKLRMFISKVEMGQGVHTSIAQVAAEELGIPWRLLDVRQAAASRNMGDPQGTSGSTSITASFGPLREASANLREILKTQAGALLGLPGSKVDWRGEGFAEAANPAGRIVSLRDLAASPLKWEVPKEKPVLRSVTDYKVIGQSQPRVDIPAKVDGSALYAYDMRLPGMLYGAVLRKPTLEATLKDLKTDTAAARAGVTRVVRDGSFVGVVANSRQTAWSAISDLDATWNEGKRWQQAEIDALITVGVGGRTVVQSEGDAPAALARGVTLRSEYRSPLAVQTPLEAQAALADVRADGATVWAATQGPEGLRGQLATALGMDAAKIEVIAPYVGGGFGRKSFSEAAIEAARLSKAAGVPVHVAWNRTEELRHGYLRPPTHHVLNASMDAAGRVSALQHQQASGDVLFSFFPGIAKTIVGADFGAYRGAHLRYTAVPNRETVTFRSDLPVRTGPWRGLGLMANAFAVESFIDELAAMAKIDPLQFRLNHLADDAASRRLAGVLKLAAEKGGWGTAAPAGRARGIACCVDAGTMVAQVAEVSVTDSGQIKVHKITCAMDAGLIINPDGARAQAEGNIMWGVGSALFEEARVVDGQIEAGNFDTYQLLRIKDAPLIDVHLTRMDDEPRGIGEPPMGPTAPAIAAAVFALTGKRLRHLPMRPERVKAA